MVLLSRRLAGGLGVTYHLKCFSDHCSMRLLNKATRSIGRWGASGKRNHRMIRDIRDLFLFFLNFSWFSFLVFV